MHREDGSEVQPITVPVSFVFAAPALRSVLTRSSSACIRFVISALLALSCFTSVSRLTTWFFLRSRLCCADTRLRAALASSRAARTGSNSAPALLLAPRGVVVDEEEEPSSSSSSAASNEHGEAVRTDEGEPRSLLRFLDGDCAGGVMATSCGAALVLVMAVVMAGR